MSDDGIVVVGGGQAGFQVCASLRDNGYTGKVALVCDEGVLPYERPPLSKGYLTADTEISLRAKEFYANNDIGVVFDRVASLDRGARSAFLEGGGRIGYRKLVLATGARARKLPVAGSRLKRIVALRTSADADLLRRLLESSRNVVVVGAGFIGLEVASTARALGRATTIVETLSRAMARVVTAETAARLTSLHRDKGAKVLLNRRVTAFDGDGGGYVSKVVLDDGSRLDADLVLVGIGVSPNVELAATAELAVNDGIVVDEYLRTSDPDIHAIGDCANFPSPHGIGRVRLESVQNAVDQANAVAATLTETPTAYTAVPWFWSDQCDVKLQIAGLGGGHDQSVVVGDMSTGGFSVFCFRDGRLVAVESVNRPVDHILSRRLLAGVPDLTPQEAAQPGFDLKTRNRQPA